MQISPTRRARIRVDKKYIVHKLKGHKLRSENDFYL